MPKIADNKWIWLLVFCVAVALYLVLDLLDWTMMPRQILLFPVIVLDMMICPFFGCTPAGQGLDVDITGPWATCIRLAAFSIELAAILLSIYFYNKTKKKPVLAFMLIVVLWILLSLCYFLWMFIGMFGMME